MPDSLLEKFSHTKSHLLDAYHKYRTYFDTKAEAKPLVQREYCLLLKPSLLTQSSFAAKLSTIWLSRYKIEKVLTKTNYLAKEIGTPYTQCVQRTRLRPITPTCEVEYISIARRNFKLDRSLGNDRSEHENFHEALENYLNEDIIEMSDIPASEIN